MKIVQRMLLVGSLVCLPCFTAAFAAANVSKEDISLAKMSVRSSISTLVMVRSNDDEGPVHFDDVHLGAHSFGVGKSALAAFKFTTGPAGGTLVWVCVVPRRLSPLGWSLVAADSSDTTAFRDFRSLTLRQDIRGVGRKGDLAIFQALPGLPPRREYAICFIPSKMTTTLDFVVSLNVLSRHVADDAALFRQLYPEFFTAAAGR